MNTYKVWVCLQGRQVTTHILLNASNYIEAQQIAESMYGSGNVLNVTLA
jgi:hypothetical protein